METRITVLEITLKTQWLFFRKVAYSRYDASSQIFQSISERILAGYTGGVWVKFLIKKYVRIIKKYDETMTDSTGACD
jgi:hypothetical protein